MSHKLIGLTPIGALVHAIQGKPKADVTVNPAVVDKNQTILSPDAGQTPRRRPLGLGQAQAGGSILSDTLG